MSTQVVGTTLRPQRARRTRRRLLRLDTVIMAAAVVSLIVLVVLPLAFLLIGSFWSKDGASLGHFTEIFRGAYQLTSWEAWWNFLMTGRGGGLYLSALRNSLVLGAFTGLFSLLIGLPLAWAVTRTNVPAKPLFQITATLSYLSPPFLTAIAMIYLFGPNAGMSNVLMRDVLGLPFLTFNIFSMSGLVLVTVMHTFPFVYLLASSALQSVDASYEEAAQILGASKFRTAMSITAPLVAPAVLSGTLLAFVNAIALFGSQAIIGLPGRIVTLPTRIYALFDYPPEYGLASALSLIFIVITVAALYLQNAFLRRRSYVTLAGKGSRPQMIALGAFRWVLFGFVVAVFFVSIILPYSTLIVVSFSRSFGLAFWNNLTLDNYRFILFEYDVTYRAIWNSLRLAIAAATIVVLLGAVIAWIDLRTKIRGRKFLDYTSLVPLGLPGIVMAVALIQFWLGADNFITGAMARIQFWIQYWLALDFKFQLSFGLYGSLTILLLAYLGRSIPLGVRTANASLRQVDPSLEESAQILGAKWSTILREITLPLIRPGLLAGWLLVFVPVMQELSASILLFSSSSITLAVAVFNLFDTGAFEKVAAFAMINMLIICAPLWLAYRIAGRGVASRSQATPVHT